MIYITGDTHGSHDWQKIQDWYNSNKKDLKINDKLIVAGDFGVFWSYEEDDREYQLKQYYDSLKIRTFFVDGNHENHERLAQFKTMQFGGSKVGIGSKKIRHLKRSQVYDIEGLKVFTFGGARSVDKAFRIQGQSWWPGEIPSHKEMDDAIELLEQYGNEVDVVITHTLPLQIVGLVEDKVGYRFYGKESDPTSLFLDEVYNRVKFKKWYAGHFHVDVDLGDKFSLLYNRVKKVEV